MKQFCNMEEYKKEQIDKLYKTSNKGINPILNDIISILFLPAGLLLMLLDSSIPKAYKTVIITLIVLVSLWVFYTLFYA